MEAQVSTVIHDGTKHFENEKLINIADDIKLNFKTNYDIVENQIAKSDELNITNLSETDNPQDAQGKNQAPNFDQGKCEGEISSNCTDVGVSKEKSDNENEESKTKQIEEDEKAMLLSFINEVEQRAQAKLQLREKNQAPSRPEEAALAKLDSSLKKNTAFIRKLRNFTAPQLASLIKDMSTLNLSKYISEVASALVEAKLKLNDVPAAVLLCSQMHTTYLEFSKVLLEHWVKTLSLKKDEKIANPSKLRVDLRFYGDLITSGIFQYKEALTLLGNVLTFLSTSDREEHNNISIILSFCKHCGEDYAGLVPRTMRVLSEKHNIPIPRSSMLPPEKQKNVRSLVKDYYSSLCKHLLKEHGELQAFERQNRRILQTKGELSSERKERGEALAASFQKLHNGTVNFAEILDEDVPELPEESLASRTNTYTENFGNFRELSKAEAEMFSIGGITDSDDPSCAICLWEDEETQRFYTEFPNLKDYLPNYKVVKSDKASSATMTEEKLDEDLKEEELEDDKKEEEVVAETIEEIEESDNNSANNKILLDGFLNLLSNCVNREMIDNAAIEFLMYHNTKHHRKKLVKTLFGVPRTRLDLLPFYARLVAILNPLLPDIATDLCLLLKHDFKYHVRKKDQINIESKLKVIRFIAELVKFELYSKIEGLYCLKILLHDFSHHHIEMACTMLETCGRFFFRSPDTHQRTKVYLEQMMRMKSGKALDSRYVTMIENAYYFVNPPESPASKVKERPVMHEFIRHILYQDLTKHTESSKVLDSMRRLNWRDPQISAYAIKCLTQAWNVPYPNIKDLANLLAGLVEYQEFVAAHVVDGVLEDIRIGIEVNTKNLNQRRVAMVKYLGELYNYRMVESNDIFKVLYSLIAFGVSFDYERVSPIDPPDQLFRIRLVCTLLETCGQYFSHGPSKTKLDYFFVFFQHYFWFKHSDSVWTDDNPFPTNINHMFRDCLTSLRPTIKLSESYQEAEESARQLTEKMRSKWDPLINFQHNDDELNPIMETENENETNDEEEDDVEEDLTGVDNTRQGSLSDEGEESDEEKSVAQSLKSLNNEDEHNNIKHMKIIDREETQNDAVVENGKKDWINDNDDLDVDSDNDLSDNQNSRSHSPEDDDFLAAFDKMVSDNLQDRMRDNVKPQHVDIPVPLHVKTNAKKTYEQLQDPETEEKGTVNFVLMLRKGNKQQYKSVAVPTDSELALNLRSQEKAERVEMEKVKRLTLDINDRLEEEDYQDQLCQNQKPAMVNLNRERRHKYQHPKGAPDADVIFGRKKVQR
ncbi:regulator of nonsense transcripts 2-like isoform X1 [Macrosteles quadrilineatus]|uniref:regulator of nonsense transcripts 2-like isoform X1 n=1 Tax=Macrosteles quadrilineatus TaxID=74068 RepID=UPI0023E28AA9|nr:regulator of nonsense transcripts 2-like isoform X1 [Macrosteles quadrilineatus]